MSLASLSCNVLFPPAVPADRDEWFQESPSVMLSAVNEDYYGKMYAFLVADSDRDIDEPNNRNNVIMRDVVVVGPNGMQGFRLTLSENEIFLKSFDHFSFITILYFLRILQKVTRLLHRLSLFRLIHTDR